MSQESGPTEVIAAVVDTLRRSRSLLLDPSPRNIDWCRIAVSQCAHKIAGIMQGDRSQWDKNELSPALLRIRSELSAIANLLDSAAAYRRGMLSALSAANRPHLPDSDASEAETVRSVHVLG